MIIRRFANFEALHADIEKLGKHFSLHARPPCLVFLLDSARPSCQTSRAYLFRALAVVAAMDKLCPTDRASLSELEFPAKPLSTFSMAAIAARRELFEHYLDELQAMESPAVSRLLLRFLSDPVCGR